MKDLYIIGSGGFGREVAWLVERINAKKETWNLVGFIDDNLQLQGKIINSYPVVGTICDAAHFSDCFYVCAVGAASVREKIIQKLLDVLPNAKFATLIDPTVEMSSSVEVGEGTIICAHSILTVNISIGKHVIMNLNCTVGHDAVLRDYVTLYPSVNLSGGTKVGFASELGTGAQIIQGKTIGDRTIVGAGAVVIKDLPDRCTAVGSPAKPIKFFD